jgi:hypothetical protein
MVPKGLSVTPCYDTFYLLITSIFFIGERFLFFSKKTPIKIKSSDNTN